MFAFIGLANMIWDQNLSHTLPTLFGNGGFHIAGVVMTWARPSPSRIAVALADRAAPPALPHAPRRLDARRRRQP